MRSWRVLLLVVYVRRGWRKAPKMNLEIEAKKISSILSLIFGLVGIVLIAVAVSFYFRTQNFISDSLLTDGTVIDLVYDDDTAYPKVRFRTQAGEVIEFTSNAGSYPPAFHEGELVEIHYNPENPYEARIGSFFSLWGISIIFGVLGLVFSAIPIIIYGVRRKLFV